MHANSYSSRVFSGLESVLLELLGYILKGTLCGKASALGPVLKRTYMPQSYLWGLLRFPGVSQRVRYIPLNWQDMKSFSAMKAEVLWLPHTAPTVFLCPLLFLHFSKSRNCLQIFSRYPKFSRPVESPFYHDCGFHVKSPQTPVFELGSSRWCCIRRRQSPCTSLWTWFCSPIPLPVLPASLLLKEHDKLIYVPATIPFLPQQDWILLEQTLSSGAAF